MAGWDTLKPPAKIQPIKSRLALERRNGGGRECDSFTYKIFGV